MTTFTPWLAHDPNPHARLHLLCFPYSGSPLNLWDSWRIPGIDVLPVVLPGRGPRRDQALPASMSDMADDIAHRVIPQLPGPFALLGHSMGAWLAHAVATRLPRDRQPERLFIISAPPPPLPHMPVRRFSSLHDLPEEDMAREVIRLGGAPETAFDAIMDNIPVIRADASVVGHYQPRSLPVECPITAVVGGQEPLFYPSDVHRWREITTRDLTAQTINGGHFLVHNQQPELQRIVARDTGTGHTDPIAVIGMACRFPGATGPGEFWSLLREGRNAVGPVPADRVTNPDKQVMRVGGFIKDVEQFDADYFNFSSRAAHVADPRLRLLLMVTQEAVDDAALKPADLAGPQTGVWVGESHSDHWDLSLAAGHSPNLYTLSGGGLKSFLSGQISRQFDLQGPSITLDTSCSSGLTAVHAACQSLHTREVDTAIAAAAHLILNPDGGPSLGLAATLSPHGRSAFASSDADGYARAEGIAAVVLKRLPEALANGDPIYATIDGTAINANGQTTHNIVATSPLGQVRMIRTALANAGIRPAEIGYVEAHGPGTRRGDDVELTALHQVYGGNPRPCPIGSVKTNIGHTEPVAGLAGFIKTVLAVHHGTIPASLHHKEPAPVIDWDTSALHVPTYTRAWPNNGGMPRRAAVSSFGLSTANAHAIISQPPDQPDARPRRPRRAWNLSRYRHTAAKRTTESR